MGCGIADVVSALMEGTMFPQSDGFMKVLTKDHQAEVQRSFERYQAVKAMHAAQPSWFKRLVTLCERVRGRIVASPDQRARKA